jgi:hypothetical protein
MEKSQSGTLAVETIILIMTTNTNTDSDRLDRIEGSVALILERLDKAATDQERFNDRFTNYQQATQWVVQLAFTLIASATLTIIITSILRR